MTDSSFSIVIVHGLQGHPYKTWACKTAHRDVPSTADSKVEAAADGNGSRKSYHRIVPRFSRKSSGSSSIGPNSSLKSYSMPRDGGDVKEGQVFWPKDLLPIQYPNARILVYGYDTRVTNYLSGPTNENSIRSHGKDLLSSLAAFRKLDSPLILIAHSLGGIVVKEMLANSSNSTEDRLRNVVFSTSAVIFLGTPHRGSHDLATLGDRARSMISLLRMKTNPAILDALRLKTKDLESAQEAFSAVWSRHDFRVKTFQEGLGLTGLNFGPFGKKVVPDFSSLLGDVRERAETIQANHMEMCRFTGLDDPNYGRICGEITSIYDWLSGLNTTTEHQHHIHQQSLTANTPAVSSHEPKVVTMNEREETCLQSLQFPNMNQRTQNLADPAEGTCRWLFRHGIFIDWLTDKNQSQSCGLLWLRGKPGSGKSTMLKEAFFRVTKDMDGSECHVASFFFNAKGDDLEHSQIGMLRSILHQICSRDPDLLRALLGMVQDRRALRGEDMAPWDEEELRAFFKPQTIGHKKRIIVFIDAIDECDSESMRDVVHFWREITETAQHAGAQLSVCLSSRHYPAITVNNCPEIIMENHNHPDIVDFVGRRLDLGMSGRPEDRKAIQQKMLEKSGGVFLWVSLVLKDILRKKDEGWGMKALLKDLNSVPRELEDLFHQLLTAGPSSKMIARMFQWALLPAKPLRLHEWHHILAFIGEHRPSSLRQWRQSDAHTGTDEELEKRITHLSRGLLDFNIRSSDDNSHESAEESMSDRAGAGSLDLDTGETRVVQVIHESLRQYFMEGPGFAVLNSASGEHSLGHAHLSMMNVCLDYILIAELDALVKARERAQVRTRDRYVQAGTGRRRSKGPGMLTSTMSHASDSLAGDDFETRRAFHQQRARRDSAASVASFGSAGSHDGAETPGKLRTKHREETEEAKPAWSAIKSSSTKKLRSMSPSEGGGESPVLPVLDYLKKTSRLAGTHEFTSSWLKDQFVTDQPSYDVPAAQASQHTSVTGCTEVLEDYPALLSYATFELFTHARKADAEGLNPNHIIWRLQDGAWDRWKALREDVDERIELLYFAADLGLSSWLKAGLWKERHIYLAIELAIDNKNAEVFEKLLGAFASAKCLRNTSSMILRLTSAKDAALLQAFLSWHPSKEYKSMAPVKAKMDTLASKNKEGRTALHLAIIQQNIAGVSVLLEHNANVSARDYRHRTPLHLACMNQSRTTVFMDGIPASDGILAPRSDIIELLLDHDADIDAADEEGRTPLMMACSNSGLPSRQSIDDDSVSIEIHSDGGVFDIAEMLLKRGANVMKSDHMGFLPLHEACWNSPCGRQSKVLLVRKLLDWGSPVNAAGVGCGTSLHLACYSPDIEIVEELLRRGADPSLRDFNGKIPLHIAIVQSTEQVVKTLLLFLGTSVCATDNFGATPLHLACDTYPVAGRNKPGTLSIIRRLLAHGANAYTLRDGNGDSPADLAWRYGIREILELMIKESWDAPLC